MQPYCKLIIRCGKSWSPGWKVLCFWMTLCPCTSVTLLWIFRSGYHASYISRDKSHAVVSLEYKFINLGPRKFLYLKPSYCNISTFWRWQLFFLLCLQTKNAALSTTTPSVLYFHVVTNYAFFYLPDIMTHILDTLLFRYIYFINDL
jgi:hypothetical protein